MCVSGAFVCSPGSCVRLSEKQPNWNDGMRAGQSDGGGRGGRVASNKRTVEGCGGLLNAP